MSTNWRKITSDERAERTARAVIEDIAACVYKDDTGDPRLEKDPVIAIVTDAVRKAIDDAIAEDREGRQ